MTGAVEAVAVKPSCAAEVEGQSHLYGVAKVEMERRGGNCAAVTSEE